MSSPQSGTPPEALDTHAIRARLGSASGVLLRVEVHDTLRSTNESLLQRARAGEDIHGLAVFAEQQSAGRGRRGRTWQSPPGGNLYLSFGWRQRVDTLDGMSLVAGLAVRRALREDAGVSAMLKWPNDIVVEGRKLGGILVELHITAGGEASAVIGIGLNLLLPAEVVASIDQPCIDLAHLAGGPVARNALAAAIVQELARSLERFSRESLAGFRAEWNEADALRGLEIEARGAGEVLSGIAAGLDAQGALLLDSGGALHAVTAGEVSVRART